MSTQKLMDIIDLRIAELLHSPMKEEWAEILEEKKKIEEAGERLADHPDLLDRMDEIMLSDEFCFASSTANNEFMEKETGISTQWWLDTAPKNEL